MNNTRTLELINALVNGKEERTYREEMLWSEFYEACVKELNKKASMRNYDFFDIDWSQEDYVQEVMFEVFKNLHKYDVARAQFATWLGGVGDRIYRKHLSMCTKKRNKGFEVTTMYVEDDECKDLNIIDKFDCTNSVEKDYFHELAMSTMYDAIDGLKSNYRKVVTLCDLEGRKPREVAKVLGCNSKDVHDWLYRGHRALAKSLDDEAFEGEIF